MSNIAGVLFGLPVALVVLSRLSAYQIERTNRIRTERLLVEAVQDLDKVIYSLITPAEGDRRDDNETFSHKFQELLRLEERLLEVVESSSFSSNEYGRLQPDSPLQIAAKEYAEVRSALCYMLYKRLTVTHLDEVDKWRDDLRVRWRYIDRILRYQYHEFNTAWPIDYSHEIRIAKAVALDLTPATLLQLAGQAYNDEDKLVPLCKQPAPHYQHLSYILALITPKANAKTAIQELEELSELFHALDSVVFDIARSEITGKVLTMQERFHGAMSDSWRWKLD